MSDNEGVKIGLGLAKDMRTVVQQILGNNGQESNGRFPATNQRQPRFYKATSGIAAPANATTPGSATCTLMKFNTAGTALEATNTTETVYSFSAIATDEIFAAKTTAGKIFAETSAGTTDEYCSFAPRKTYDDTGFSGAVGQVAYNTGTNWPIQVPRFISSAFANVGSSIFDVEQVGGIGQQASRVFIKQPGIFDLFAMVRIRQQVSLIDNMNLLDEDGITTRYAGQFYAPGVTSAFFLMAEDCGGFQDGTPFSITGLDQKIYTALNFPNIGFPYLNASVFDSYFCHSTSFSITQLNLDSLGGRIELNHLVTVGSSNTPSISGSAEINWATGSSGILAYRGGGISRALNVPSCNGGVDPII